MAAYGVVMVRPFNITAPPTITPCPYQVRKLLLEDTTASRYRRIRSDPVTARKLGASLDELFIPYSSIRFAKERNGGAADI